MSRRSTGTGPSLVRVLVQDRRRLNEGNFQSQFAVNDEGQMIAGATIQPLADEAAARAWPESNLDSGVRPHFDNA